MIPYVALLYIGAKNTRLDSSSLCSGVIPAKSWSNTPVDLLIESPNSLWAFLTAGLVKSSGSSLLPVLSTVSFSILLIDGARDCHSSILRESVNMTNDVSNLWAAFILLRPGLSSKILAAFSLSIFIGP